MSGGGLDFAAEFQRLRDAGQSESTTRAGGVAIRLVRVVGGGERRWDSHPATTETAIVWSGDFRVEFRDSTLNLDPGQCCVVPAGAEHRGTSKCGAEVILFTNLAG